MSMGSCFAVMIGQKFSDFKFNCRTNPLGILYNPVSLHKTIDLALSGDRPDPSRTTTLHERYVHHDFHSEIWGESKTDLMNNLNERLHNMCNSLMSANWLILTYGTAMMHRLEGTPVANCHKRPAREFSHKMATINALKEASLNSLVNLKKANPGIRVILTVSPVRHIKDTLPVNSLSKSKLRILCEELTSGLEFVEYFPSYEVMVDDLRDYRYYTNDLIHPSPEAEDYIWQLFGKRYFRETTGKLIDTWGKLRKNLLHRPFNPESTDHKTFLRHTLNELEQLADKLPVDDEIIRVKTLLSDA
jgi:hypothetical protein